MEYLKVLNVNINNLTMQEAVKKLEEYVASKSPHLIATANAEMIMLAQNDKEFFEILNTADLVVPDGAGVIWAGNHLGFKMKERVAGFDLVQEILRISSTKNYKIYFVGGEPGITEKAKATAEKLYPGIQIVGTEHGFFQSDEDLIAKITASKPDFLFFALGVPKQEKWLKKYLTRLDVPVAMGVGGTFDVMAGTTKRAPIWMQQAGLEWLYRLLKQPQRAKRMLALPKFAIEIFCSKNR